MTRIAALDYVISRAVKLLFAETLAPEAHMKQQLYTIFSDMISQDMVRKLDTADKAIRPLVDKVKEKLNARATPEERSKLREELSTAAQQALEDAGVSPDLASLLTRSYIGEASLVSLFGPSFQMGSEYNTQIRNKAFAKMPNIDQLIDAVISAKDEERLQAWDTLMRSFISAAGLALDQYPTIPKPQSRKPRSEKKTSEIWGRYDMASRGLRMLFERVGIDQANLDAYMKDYLTEAGLGIVDDEQIKSTILKGLETYLKGKTDEKVTKEILSAFEGKLKGITETPDPEKLLQNIAAQILLNPSEENTKKLLSLHMSKLEKAPELLTRIRKALVPVGVSGDSPRAMAKGGWVPKLVQHLNNMYIVQLKKFLEMPSTKEALTPEIKEKIGLTPEIEKMMNQPWTNIRYEYEVSRDTEKELAQAYPDLPIDQKEKKVQQALKSQTLMDSVITAAQDVLNKIRKLPNADPFKQEFLRHMASYIQEPAFMSDLLAPALMNKDLARLTKKQRAEKSVKPIGSKDRPISSESDATMEDLLSATTDSGPQGGLSRIPLTLNTKQLVDLISWAITDQTGYKATGLAPVITEAVNSTLAGIKDTGEELTIGSFLYGGLASDLLNAFEEAKLPIPAEGVESVLNAVEGELKKKIFKEEGLGEQAVTSITGAVRKHLMRVQWLPDNIKSDISALVREFVYNGEEGAKAYLASKGLQDANDRQKIVDNYLIPARSVFTQRSLAERKLFKPQGR